MKLNSPPEDCGSIPGYEDIIEALKSNNKSEYQDTLDWLGDYDPEKFNIDDIRFTQTSLSSVTFSLLPIFNLK